MAVGVRQRWFSGRAVLLHLSLLVWFPGCLIAGWWQVNRAFDGNGLSYLYSVEWPIFALVGVWGWWQLVHMDFDTVGQRAQQRMAAQHLTETGDGAASEGDGAPAQGPPRRHEEEDDALRAYNDRLAELATRGPQTWRNR